VHDKERRKTVDSIAKIELLDEEAKSTSAQRNGRKKKEGPKTEAETLLTRRSLVAFILLRETFDVC
jgi:hypothetical protein